MPYPRHLLNEGEQISLDLRPHWWFFSRHILTGIPLFIALIAATQIEDDTLSKVALWPLGIIAIVWAGWLFVKFLEWTRTHFVVTTDRVIFRTGVIARHGVEIPHERINNINFNQKIFERMIGAGDLEIESAGKDGVSTFENVRHPDGVQQEIYRQMELNATRDAGVGASAVADAVSARLGAAPAGPSAGIPEQIAQLARLRDQGHITEEEFQRKKTELLSRM
jgi:uncharacterized membrane protein YdbT with pleckstrin-like domain